jgi:hypothetical protein
MPEEGGAFVLVGSNFGRPEHPAWTANLLRNPEAEVMGGAAAVLAAVRGVCGARGAGDPALPADAALDARAGGLGIPYLAPSRNQGATPWTPGCIAGCGWVGGHNLEASSAERCEGGVKNQYTGALCRRPPPRTGQSAPASSQAGLLRRMRGALSAPASCQ